MSIFCSFFCVLLFLAFFIIKIITIFYTNNYPIFQFKVSYYCTYIHNKADDSTFHSVRYYCKWTILTLYSFFWFFFVGFLKLNLLPHTTSQDSRIRVLLYTVQFIVNTGIENGKIFFNNNIFNMFGTYFVILTH